MKLFVDQDAPRKADEKQFQLEEWIEGSPFETLLGTEILEAEAGRAVLRLPYTVKLSNGGGVMHGGAMMTLADTAVAMAIKSLVPEGTPFATIKMSMEFVAPVLEGAIIAKAVVAGSEERTFHGVCELYGEKDVLCARMESAFKLVRSA